MAPRYTLLLAFILPSLAFAGEDQGTRRFLNGAELGALSNPAVLTTEAHAQALCSALKHPRNSPKLGEVSGVGQVFPKRDERIKRYKQVSSAIYTTTVQPKGFRFDEYRYEDEELPIKADHALVALDGALSLSVMDRRGAGFSLAPQEAKATLKAHEAGALALKVTFQIDRGSMDSCFSYPMSAAYSLRIRPLTYELIKVGTQASVAQVRTPALRKLRGWLTPGAPSFAVEVVRLSGALDERELEDSIRSSRPALESCMAPIKQSEAETGVVAVGLELSSRGEVIDSKIVMEAVEQRDVSRCVLEVLRDFRTAGPSAKIQVLVSVERS